MAKEALVRTCIIEVLCLNCGIATHECGAIMEYGVLVGEWWECWRCKTVTRKYVEEARNEKGIY